MSEYQDAVVKILTVFDNDPLMTEEILSADPDQRTAQDAALARIREIGRTALEGRRPPRDDEVPGMHEHSWDLTAVQEHVPVLAFTPAKPGKYTTVLGRCSSCGEPGSWTLAGTWTLDQVTGAGT